MVNLFEILSSLEENENLHLGRLLILINTFSEKEKKGKIEGLTKLAKLDFLLRYPQYLEKALIKKGKSTKKIAIDGYERRTIESSMVRYRYGPWDFRYRRFLNILIAKGLVKIEEKGRTIIIEITESGSALAEKLAKQEDFSKTVKRAILLKNNFNIQATSLMRFIYETFPEIGTLRLGEEINSENLF